MYAENSDMAPSYKFEVSSLMNAIKSIEIEIDMVELFYNLHFYPFNVDAWFSKRLVKIIRPQILVDFPRAKSITDSFPGKTIPEMNLRTIQLLRNIILDLSINKKERIEIRSTHLNESYTCLLEGGKLKVFNAIHKDNYISIGSGVFALEDNINKHVLFQFILNPFWEDKSFSYGSNRTDLIFDEESSIVVLNSDNSVVKMESLSDVCFLIDNYNDNWNEPFVKRVLNVYLGERAVNINDLERGILSIILSKTVDEDVKRGVWNHYKNMAEAIYETRKSGERKYLFSHDQALAEESKGEYVKTLIWDQFSPVYTESFLEKNVFDKYKNHTFYDLGQDVISKLKNYKLCCNDIYIVSQLLCVNPELIHALPYFLGDSPELPVDFLRKRIIKAYFENEYSGKKYLSAFGLHYMIKNIHSNRSMRFCQTNIIFTDELFKISSCIEKLGSKSFFELLGESDVHLFPNSKISKLVNEPSSMLSKALTLLIVYNRKLSTWNHWISLFVDKYPESIPFLIENRASIADYPILRMDNSHEIINRDEDYISVTKYDIVTQYLTQHKILRNSNTRSYHDYSSRRVGFQEFVKDYISRATYTLSGSFLKVTDVEWSGCKEDIYDILLCDNCPVLFDFNMKIQFPEYTYIYDEGKIYLKKNIDHHRKMEMVIDVKNIQVDLLVWILSIKY